MSTTSQLVRAEILQIKYIIYCIYICSHAYSGIVCLSFQFYSDNGCPMTLFIATWNCDEIFHLSCYFAITCGNIYKSCKSEVMVRTFGFWLICYLVIFKQFELFLVVKELPIFQSQFISSRGWRLIMLSVIIPTLHTSCASCQNCITVSPKIQNSTYLCYLQCHLDSLKEITMRWQMKCCHFIKSCWIFRNLCWI